MTETPTQDHARARRSAGARKAISPVLALGLLASMVAPSSAVTAQSLREVRRISASANDLSGVGTAAVGPDGAIWFEQYEDGVILGFAPNSTTPRRVGRAGEGPGDMRTVTQLFVRQQDLWMADWRLQRATSFDPSGRVNSTAQLPRPAGLTSPRLEAASPTGATWWRSIAPGGQTFFAAVPRDDAPPLALLGFSLTECVVGRPTKTGSMAIMVPFCHHGSFAFSPNGEFAAEALPLPLVEGRSGVQVVVVSVKGDTVLNRQLSVAPSPIPNTVRDSAIGSRLRGASSLTKEVMKEMSDRDLIPRVYSPVVDLRISDVGDVVVDVVSGRTAERHLAMLRRNTKEILMVPIQRTQSLRWFGGDRVLMVDEDDDGLQDVVLYQIVANR